MLHRKFNGQSIRINYSMNNIDDDVWVYLRRNILVYFGLIVSIFAASWLFTITLEPDETWTEHGHAVDGKPEPPTRTLAHQRVLTSRLQPAAP